MRQAETEVTVALENARELVKMGWCQGSAAKFADGREAYPAATHPDPAQFDTAGALMRAIWPWTPEEETHENSLLTEECFDLLLSVIREEYGWDMSAHPSWQVISEWNDEPKRTKGEVVALFDSAIEKAQGREAA